MYLLVATWTHHLNHLIYSYFYFCKREKIRVDIRKDASIVSNGAVLVIDHKKIFFDYSDDYLFMEKPERYHQYYKRSLREVDHSGNVLPLNFNVPLAYKSASLLWNMRGDILFDKWSRIEVLKALDIFGLVSKSSHSVLDVRRYPETAIDNGGKVLFHTRLWNPDNHPDPEEKERRRLQNEFRINACRIIKENFKDAAVGLFADSLSQKTAPDLLLHPNEAKKNNYLNRLINYDIGIADDGLKDTPGWKIGEYLFYGKAVITTPLNVVIENFNPQTNYEVLTSRSSFQELLDKINNLLKNKSYFDMGLANKDWSDRYIHPKNYIDRIVSNLKI